MASVLVEVAVTTISSFLSSIFGSSARRKARKEALKRYYQELREEYKRVTNHYMALLRSSPSEFVRRYNELLASEKEYDRTHVSRTALFFGRENPNPYRTERKLAWKALEYVKAGKSSA